MLGNVERVLADINADDGDRVENLGHGVLLVWVPPASIRLARWSTAGPSHYRTSDHLDLCRKLRS
jgi:hypothetical protein